MSGGFGWGGKYRSDHRASTPSYDDAYKAYDPPKAPATPPSHNRVHRVPAPAAPPSPKKPKIETGPHKDLILTCTAQNLIVIALDMTGSMGSWRQEILDRMSTLYEGAAKLLGDDLDVLFIAFGDPESCSGDVILTTPLGRGKVLEDHLEVLKIDQRGGGNAQENSELAALFTLNHVSQEARNAFFFTVTDERHSEVDAYTARRLGIREPYLSSLEVYRALQRRMHVYTVFSETGCYREEASFVDQWRATLNTGAGDHVITLNDSRRVVDVILGTIAKLTSQYEEFSTMLEGFQAHTRHGRQNIETVHRSLSLVGTALQDPSKQAGKRSKPLL